MFHSRSQSSSLQSLSFGRNRRLFAALVMTWAFAACDASTGLQAVGGGTAGSAGEDGGDVVDSEGQGASTASAVSASPDTSSSDPLIKTDTWLVDPNYAQVSQTENNPAAITLHGFSRQAGAQVSLQVSDLTQATQTWVTIATVTTDAKAQAVKQEQLYSFEFDKVALSRVQWPKNGLVHLRALIGTNASVSFDASRDNCARLTASTTWTQFAENCSTNRPFVTLVDGSDKAPLTTIDYLFPPSTTSLLQKQIDADETNRYMKQTGLLDRVPTLARFQALYNLNGVGTKATAKDTSAVYYNYGDLGFGREMHCNKSNDGTIGCAVTNYGQPGGDASIALDLALAQNTPIATVAMEYRPNAATDKVTFIVYDGAGNPLTEAALDSEGAKATPLICMSCHGGTYDTNTHSITGTSFLPFDTDELLYSNKQGFRLADQSESFRKLNALVAETNASEGITSMITGWYGSIGVNTAGAKLDNRYVPVGWQDQKALYTNVIKPYCRSCHNSLAAPLSWPTSASFLAMKAQVQDDICNRAAMPRSEQTVQHFWQSGASAVLVDSLKLQTTCSPQ